jgi:cytochrome o ubiquinol oxidase subunit 1
MHWFMAFIVVFTIGGMAGVLMAAPPADFQVHNSLFLVAHFHTMVIGAAIFGFFAGFSFWFPKMTGILLNERIGRRAFWLWLTGYFVSFIPLYLLGFMGAPRRIDHYDAATGFQPFYIASAIGFVIIMCGLFTQIYQIFVSLREKKPAPANPWNGKTLEWATTSPPAFYNFTKIPTVTGREEYYAPKEYEDIKVFRNTGMGIYISGLALLLGFALVWHMWGFAIFGLAGCIACVIVRSFDEDTEYVLTAAEMEKNHGK